MRIISRLHDKAVRMIIAGDYMIMRTSTLHCLAVLCSLVASMLAITTIYAASTTEIKLRLLSRDRVPCERRLTTVAQLRARNLLPVNQM